MGVQLVKKETYEEQRKNIEQYFDGLVKKLLDNSVYRDTEQHRTEFEKEFMGELESNEEFKGYIKIGEGIRNYSKKGKVK